MSTGDKGFVRVRDVVPGVLDHRGVGSQLRRVGVLDAWSDVVGAAIDEVTSPRSVSDATLFVEVRSSSWLTELSLMRREILERLNLTQSPDAKIEKLVFVLAES